MLPWTSSERLIYIQFITSMVNRLVSLSTFLTFFQVFRFFFFFKKNYVLQTSN